MLPATYWVGASELMALTSTGGSGWAMSDKVPPRVWACAGAGSAIAAALQAAMAQGAQGASCCGLHDENLLGCGCRRALGATGTMGRRGNSATHRLGATPLLQKEREGRGHARHAGQGHCFVDAMDVARL